MRSFRGLLPLIALAVAAPALADDTGGHPDLSGFWNLDMSPHKADAAMIAKLPPNTAVLDDTGPTEFPRGEYGGLKPKPAALARAAKWKPEDEMTLTRLCAAPEVIYTEQGPFPFEISQTPTLIVF